MFSKSKHLPQSLKLVLTILDFPFQRDAMFAKQDPYQSLLHFCLVKCLLDRNSCHSSKSKIQAVKNTSCQLKSQNLHQARYSNYVLYLFISSFLYCWCLRYSCKHFSKVLQKGCSNFKTTNNCVVLKQSNLPRIVPLTFYMRT